MAPELVSLDFYIILNFKYIRSIYLAPRGHVIFLLFFIFISLSIMFIVFKVTNTVVMKNHYPVPPRHKKASGNKSRTNKMTINYVIIISHIEIPSLSLNFTETKMFDFITFTMKTKVIIVFLYYVSIFTSLFVFKLKYFHGIPLLNMCKEFLSNGCQYIYLRVLISCLMFKVHFRAKLYSENFFWYSAQIRYFVQCYIKLLVYTQWLLLYFTFHSWHKLHCGLKLKPLILN